MVQGLIHISELAWSRVSNPETVVQPGSLVKCKVINVDRERGKIGLSLKVCALRSESPSPGSALTHRVCCFAPVLMWPRLVDGCC